MPIDERSTRHRSFLVEMERTSDTHSESLQATGVSSQPATYSATMRKSTVPFSVVNHVGERPARQQSQDESSAGYHSGTLLDPGSRSRPPTYSAVIRIHPPSYESLMGSRNCQSVSHI